jgi:hypothetical protein|tara:strand:+ start:419 stop:574 length:156 start_codon:yes stop_codon:yes gene_type:complete
MAIQEAQINKVKTDATVSIARAKARAAQVTANAHVLKAKRFISRGQSKGDE